MFSTLFESGGRGSAGRAPSLSWSVAIHAALITLAVARTMDSGARSAPPPVEVVPLRLIPPAVVEPARGRESSEAGVAAPVTVTLPRFEMPDVQGIDLPQPAAALPGSDEWSPAVSISPRSRPGPAAVYSEDRVDRVVIPRANNGSPAYPRGLRMAALEGEVRFRFVVDTAGTVEPGSLAVLSSTHELFADAVRTWLQRTRYQPAEVAGRRVRQLVEQRVSFTLQR